MCNGRWRPRAPGPAASARSLPRALDRDEFVASASPAAGAVRRNRAGDLVAVKAPVRRRLAELARAAIGRGRGGAAGIPAREAAVDAISVGVVGNDEGALLGLRRDWAIKIQRDTEGQRGKQVAHRSYSLAGCTGSSVAIGECARPL